MWFLGITYLPCVKGDPGPPPFATFYTSPARPPPHLPDQQTAYTPRGLTHTPTPPSFSVLLSTQPVFTAARPCKPIPGLKYNVALSALSVRSATPRGNSDTPYPMALGDLPAEILEEIILVIIAHSPLGLPLELAALLLTSRAIYTKLSPHNFPHLHSRVFMSKFDPPCALLSLGSVDGINLPSSHDLTQELRARFSALKLFTTGRLDDPEFSDALMTAFIMTLEDAGRNAAQLRHSGLPRLLREYICTRLRDDALTSTHGWPAQSHINSVILYLFWALSSECKSFVIRFFFFLLLVICSCKLAWLISGPGLLSYSLSS
jgi:hypothetical protein